MSRWLIRLAFPALGILVALMFVGVKAPENPVKTETASSASTPIPSFEALIPAPVPAEGPEIIFKWQDSDGGWHYADQPPAHGPWHALAIGNMDRQPADKPDYDELHAPYTAPFRLQPQLPGNGS